jgi:hypothetical protein
MNNKLLSKEEILKKYMKFNEAGETMADENWNPLVRYNSAITAMDEYARQEAIEFNKWANKEWVYMQGVTEDTPNLWFPRRRYEGIPPEMKTDDQLYEKYLESKTREKEK